jgi:hypothetical protein
VRGVAAEKRRRQLSVGMSLVLVAVAAVLAIVGGGGNEDEVASGSIPPQLVEADALPDLEEFLGHPLYWAGAREGLELELSADVEGNAYLRYLPEGTEAADPRQTFLTVGSYPVADAQDALRETAAESGLRVERLDEGAVLLRNPSAPGSVYLAYPDGDVEIEVYHPDPGRAMELVRAGAIERVDG